MPLSNRAVLVLIAINGIAAVAFGAFAAHAVSDPDAQALLRTAAGYQLAHAAAGAAVLNRARWGAFFMSLGALVFAGSLYALALLGMRWLGALTPLGGLLMIAGWSVLLAHALRSPESSIRKSA